MEWWGAPTHLKVIHALWPYTSGPTHLKVIHALWCCPWAGEAANDGHRRRREQREVICPRAALGPMLLRFLGTRQVTRCVCGQAWETTHRQASQVFVHAQASQPECCACTGKSARVLCMHRQVSQGFVHAQASQPGFCAFTGTSARVLSMHSPARQCVVHSQASQPGFCACTGKSA